MNEASAQTPFLSLAIPVYNQAGTIRGTVESALEAFRGEAGVEIVISENHSTDGTAELLSDFGERVKIVRPPFHFRMAANWNFAVRSCSGSWVGMLSGDDKILPGYVESIRKIVSRRDSAVFAYGGWRNVDASSGVASRRTVMSMPAISAPRNTVRSLLRGPKASFSSYCFLRSAFERVGGFPEEYSLIQDWILQFRLAFVGDFVKTNSIIAEYLTGQDRESLEFRRVPLYVGDIVNFCCQDIWSSSGVAVPRRLVLDACMAHACGAEKLLNRFPDWRSKGDEILLPLYTLIGREKVAINRKTWRELYLPARARVRQLLQSFF